jgi:hypothetical protein
MQPYSTKIHSADYIRSLQSAKEILPLVLNKYKPISSVIDVGGGIGAWLHAAHDYNVGTLFLIDGDYVTKDHLKINEIKLINHNLEFELPSVNKRFDLAISVEVAEHLSEARADSFIKDLCGLSDLILFSAAIPGQGGHKHINEKWLSYWVELFSQHGYFPDDFIRSQIWKNKNIEWWYRQNIIIFQKNGSLRQVAPLDLVHPEQFLSASKSPSFKSFIWKKFKNR